MMTLTQLNNQCGTNLTTPVPLLGLLGPNHNYYMLLTARMLQLSIYLPNESNTHYFHKRTSITTTKCLYSNLGGGGPTLATCIL
jgi:hypothetical protein